MPAVTPLLTWLFLDQQLGQFKHQELTVNAEMPLLETFFNFCEQVKTEAALKDSLTKKICNHPSLDD